MRPLLVLVDFQEDFLLRKELSPHRDSLTDRAQLLQKEFRTRGAPILHIRTRVTRDPDVRMPHWKTENRWLCLEGSAGYAAPEALREETGEFVLHKSGFTASGLVDRVREHTPGEIILCGIMLHACVRQAAIQLHEAGWKVILVDDAVGSDDPVHAAISRRYLQDRGIDFRNAQDIAQGLGAPATLHRAIPDEFVAVEEETEILSNARNDWEATPIEKRAEFASGLIETLRNQAAETADRIAVEIGKPVQFGKAEIERSAEMIGAILDRLINTPFETREGPSTVRRRPHGTVAIVTPWNNPVYIPLGKIIPALVCGNTVAWKPAPEAVEISRWLLSSIREAGLPENVLRMLSGSAACGRQLVEDSRIDAVSLTGSLITGHSVGEICTRRHIPFQAELGGNNPAIVWSDADLPAAAGDIAAGAFEMAGQRCTANRRVIVHSEIADEFIALLVDATSRLHWGEAADPNTKIGPLVDHEKLSTVEALMDRAEKGGLPIHFPLGRHSNLTADQTLAWCPPRIVECDEPEHEIVQEELFAPILVVQKATTWGEALELANGVRQGLAAVVFTKSDKKIAEFLTEARAGILKLNCSTADAAIDVPFGGWKSSGIGPPEHGKSDLEFYTRSQTLYGAE